MMSQYNYETFNNISGTGKQTLSWRFRDPAGYKVIGDRDLNINKTKVLGIVIERENIADNIINPLSGALDIHEIWFVPNRREVEPINDDEMVDLLERRAAQYFIDWSSRKPESLGIPQDRSTFGDLLTVGGIGFALPAYIIAAERGWISRSNAVINVRSVLRIMNNQRAFGSETIGRIGYKGWFYHFLGTDGRRKLNFDFLTTPENESLNTVELSSVSLLQKQW